MNALCAFVKFCKDSLTGIGHGANGVNKTPPFLYFPIGKAGKRTIAHMPIAEWLSFSNLDNYNCKLQNEKEIFNLSAQ
jgi:hypothetical protein